MKLCSGALLTENSAVYPFKRIATYPTPVLIKTIGMKDVNVYSDGRNAILCTVFFQIDKYDRLTGLCCTCKFDSECRLS